MSQVNISNTRRHVSSDMRSVWISDETHFQVFHMASQMINNSWRNSRLKLAKFMVITCRNTYPNHGHGSDFLCFLLMNY